MRPPLLGHRWGSGPFAWRMFGNDVLIVMHRRGRLSLRQAAVLAAVSPSTMSRLTKHADPVSVDNLARICLWAGLSIDYYVHPVS